MNRVIFRKVSKVMIFIFLVNVVGSLSVHATQLSHLSAQKELDTLLKRIKKCSLTRADIAKLTAVAVGGLIVIIGGRKCLVGTKISKTGLEILKSNASHKVLKGAQFNLSGDYYMWQDDETGTKYYHETSRSEGKKDFIFLLDNNPNLRRVRNIGSRTYDLVRADSSEQGVIKFVHSDGTESYWRTENSSFE